MILLDTVGLALLICVVGYFLLQDIVVIRAWRNAPNPPMHGAAALVGRKAEVTAAFSRESASINATGNVRLDGETWRAELAPDTQPLPKAGESVVIVAVSGLLLTVERC